MRSRYTSSALLVLLALPAIARPALAYRTGADLSELQGTERVRFVEDRIAYELTESVPEPMNFEDYRATVKQALDTWSAPACSDLRFTYRGISLGGALPADGRNTLEWVFFDWEARGFARDQAAVTDVQYVREGGGDWRIVEADLYLNAEQHRWVLAGAPAGDERDLLSVLTHEAGHMLGLLHPCEPDGQGGAPICGPAGPDRATMHPYYAPEQATLEDDDRAGLCFLYPSASCNNGECPPEPECSATGCEQDCGGAVCSAGQVCVAERCLDLSLCDGGQCSACTSDADCPGPLRCERGSCALVPAVPGDVCLDGADCAGAVCLSDGYCAAACAADSQCEDGERCVQTAAGRACVGDKLGMGAECSSASDCLGGECLAGAADAPLCTRQCSGQRPACPAGWQCEAVGGVHVCAPNEPNVIVPAGGGGCRMRPSPSGPLSGFASVLALATLFALRRRTIATLRRSLPIDRGGST
jgi:hypothetical protein